MKKVIFLAIFATLLVPSLTFAVVKKPTVLQTWINYANALLEENKQLKAQISRLEEINRNLAISDQTVSYADSLTRQKEENEQQKRDIKTKIATIRLEQQLLKQGQLDHKYGCNEYTRSLVIQKLDTEILKLNVELAKL